MYTELVWFPLPSFTDLMAWGGIEDCVTLPHVYGRANTVRLFC